MAGRLGATPPSGRTLRAAAAVVAAGAMVAGIVVGAAAPAVASTPNASQIEAAAAAPAPPSVAVVKSQIATMTKVHNQLNTLKFDLAVFQITTAPLATRIDKWTQKPCATYELAMLAKHRQQVESFDKQAVAELQLMQTVLKNVSSKKSVLVKKAAVDWVQVKKLAPGFDVVHETKGWFWTSNARQLEYIYQVQGLGSVVGQVNAIAAVNKGIGQSVDQFVKAANKN